MHTLIVGNSGMDHAGFIDRLIDALEPRPKLYGYRSVKEPPGPDGRCPIYIYPVEGPRLRHADNLLGWCKNREAQAYPEAFDRYAVLIEAAKPDGLLVMDEIGPMESRSTYFRSAVLSALDGDVPIIAMVRDNDTPFLNEVRAADKARRFYLTRDNADTLLYEVVVFLKEQLTT